jgi:cell division protein FtsN
MHETTGSREHAAAKRLARGQRIHRLRMRIASAAVALFILTWGGLYIQLVSGNDPALASSQSSVATQSADPEVTSADGWSDSPATSTAQSSDFSSEPAAVSTGQS